MFSHSMENGHLSIGMANRFLIGYYEWPFPVVMIFDIPSGKRLHHYGKSPFSIYGKTHYFSAHFQWLC